MSIENVHLITLLQLFSLNTLINSPVTNNTFQPALITFLTNQKSLFKFSKTFETGLSAHHKLILSTMKVHQKEKVYRCYKNFDIANFSNTLKGNLEKVNHNSYKSFEIIFLNALNIYAPLKTKMLRFNNSVFMTKKLRLI